MKKDNISDIEQIKNGYFNLRKDELEKLKEVFYQNCNGFKSIIENIENDLESYYNKGRERKAMQPHF
jgi:hypothetical protein